MEERGERRGLLRGLLAVGAVALLAAGLLRSGDPLVVAGCAGTGAAALSVALVVSLRRKGGERYMRLLLWLVLLPAVALTARAVMAVWVRE